MGRHDCKFAATSGAALLLAVVIVFHAFDSSTAHTFRVANATKYKDVVYTLQESQGSVTHTIDASGTVGGIDLKTGNAFVEDKKGNKIVLTGPNKEKARVYDLAGGYAVGEFLTKVGTKTVTRAAYFSRKTGAKAVPLFSGGSTIGSRADATNSKGEIVGVGPINNIKRAFLATIKNGKVKMTDLGALGSKEESAALDLNEKSVVVGYSTRNNKAESRAVAWFKRGAKPTVLGSFGGKKGVAIAINDKGDIVGWSSQKNGVPHAFLYRKGTFYGLSVPSGNRRSEAVGITEDGKVIAGGYQCRKGSNTLCPVVWINGVFYDISNHFPKDIVNVELAAIVRRELKSTKQRRALLQTADEVPPHSLGGTYTQPSGVSTGFNAVFQYALAGSSCNGNKSPGKNFLGRGFDVTRGTLSPLSADDFTLTWSLNTVLDLSAWGTCINANAVPSTTYTASLYEVTSTKKLTDTWTKSVSMSTSAKIPTDKGVVSIGLRSSNTKTKTVQTVMQKSSEVFLSNAQVTSQFLSYQAGRYGPSLSKYFLNDLKSLPTTYSDGTKGAFQTFFLRYGTHYVSSLTTGGVFSFSSYLTAESYKKLTEKKTDIKKGISLGFSKAVGVDITKESTTSQQSEQDVESQWQETTVLSTGGQAGINNWTQWTATVGDNPVPVSAVLTSYIALAPKTIQPALTQALVDWVNSSFQADNYFTYATSDSGITTSSCFVWNNKGEGASKKLQVWRPCVSGQTTATAITFGDVGAIGGPGEVTAPAVPLFKEQSVDGVTNLPEIYTSPLITNGVGFDQVWTDKGSGGDYDGAVWNARCSSGYAALGSVFTMGYTAPDPTKYRCVAQRCITPCPVQLLYADHDSGATQDLSLYKAIPPQASDNWYDAGRFLAVTGFNKPPTYMQCLKAECVTAPKTWTDNELLSVVTGQNYA